MVTPAAAAAATTTTTTTPAATAASTTKTTTTAEPEERPSLALGMHAIELSKQTASLRTAQQKQQ